MENLESLHEQGYSNQQIANILNINIHSVRTMINRKGLKSNRYDLLQNDQRLREFIIGSILGDGTFDVNKSGGIRMKFAHSFKQKEYLNWKWNILKHYNLEGKIKSSRIYNNRYKNGYFDECRFASKVHIIFAEYYAKFYIHLGRRNILALTEHDFTELVFAIWFFDDSHICARSYQITCESLSEEEVIHVIQLLKANFDIDATFDKNHNIYIRTNSISTVNNIISKYVIPEMKYKMRFC